MPVTHPLPHIFFGTSAGHSALDGDKQGGNPFASALIEIAADPDAPLRSWPALLREKTSQRTAGMQVPDAQPGTGDPGWRFAESFDGEREQRTALVLVVSAYAAPQVPRLFGAEHDERRLAAMFASHGFSVTQGVAPSRRALRAALRTFAARSAESATAAIYCTGHGVEAEGRTYLLPGDYPFAWGFGTAMLRRCAVPLDRLVSSACGRQLNLVFFAGCRTVVDAAEL
jgi:hypothetical protein